ncbi:MAG: hypothetical protein P1V35_12200 [Planctomycetota bacterium]|nr:hypothetical protein [Planctomycetota bacterium]
MAGLGAWALACCAALLPGAVQDADEILTRWRDSAAGQVRAERVHRDLLAGSESDLPELQKAAYGFFMEDMASFRGRSAEHMAQAMHARAQATWSMICVSGSQLRMGKGQEAIACVREHLSRIQDSAPAEEVRAVWDRLGWVARGLGEAELMRDALGQSLAMGSEDALQLLGWEGLIEGDGGGAARLFGALLDRAQTGEREPAPWALPGWGLALLQDQKD